MVDEFSREEQKHIKKVIVFDVAATESGALTTLEEFYKKATTSADRWIFVISTPTLEATQNITVLRYPWVKKSWLHRLFFDYFIAPKLVKTFKPDEVLSLQNLVIPNIKNVKQVVYVHQSLPFVDYKVKLTDGIGIFLRQRIVGKLILKSIKKADKVIVQTKWMKDACIRKALINEKKIEVMSPESLLENLSVHYRFDGKQDSFKAFFYPAAPVYYKNHFVILKACEKLKKLGISNYKVVFTFSGHENVYARKIKKFIEKHRLQVELIGTIPREEVFKWYTKSVLVFPSFIETYGLPLLEARLCGTPIIASNTAFSQEILGEYPKAELFDPHKPDELFEIMKRNIENIKEGR